MLINFLEEHLWLPEKWLGITCLGFQTCISCSTDVQLVLIVGGHHGGVPLDGQGVCGGIVQAQVSDLFREGGSADGGGVALRPLPVLSHAQGGQGDVVIKAWN